MPKSKSLWPSMPRKVTWDKSGSFKLASPPGSSATADAAPISVSTAAVAPNLMNLPPRDQALASHTLIHFPPLLIPSPRKVFPRGIVSGTLVRPSAPEREHSAICSHSFVKMPPRAAMRLPQNSPMQHPLHRARRLAQIADL